MKRIQFLYRCRVCQETFGRGHMASNNAAMKLLAAMPQHSTEVPRFTTHECPYGGRIGIAELIGYRPVDQEPGNEDPENDN